jgi:hypothetical protein
MTSLFVGPAQVRPARPQEDSRQGMHGVQNNAQPGRSPAANRAMSASRPNHQRAPTKAAGPTRLRQPSESETR